MTAKKRLIPILIILMLIVLSGGVNAQEQLGEHTTFIENFDFLCQLNGNILCQTIKIGNSSENIDLQLTNVSIFGDIQVGDLTTSALIMNVTINASGISKPNTTIFETSTFLTSEKWTGVLGWGKNISFNKNIILRKDTDYALCLKFVGCQSTVNQFGWNGNLTGNYSGGQLWREGPTGFTSEPPLRDGLFKIWGVPVTNLKDTNETFVTNSIETDTVQFTLNISKDNATTSNSSALFFYNNTRIVPTKNNQSTFDLYTVNLALDFILSSDESITQNFFWSYNYSNSSHTLQENTTTRTNTVFRMIVNQCNTTANNRFPAQNFTVRDEISLINLEVNISGTYEIWLDPTKTRLHQFGVTNQSTFSACIHPSFASYQSNIDWTFQRTGFGIRNYVQSNLTIDNTTQSINLYLLSEGTGTDITVVVNDDEDNLLQGILVQVLRDFDNNGTFQIIDSETTNWGGEVEFSLNTDNKYKFRFFQDGVLKIDSRPAKIVSTTLFFTITDLGITRFRDFLNIDTIDRNLTHSNLTNIVNLEWVDSNNFSNLVCLDILANNIVRYSNCTASLTGTMQFLITQFNLTYFVTATARSKTGNIFILEQISIFTRDAWKDFGNDGLFLSFIVYLTLSLVALKKPKVAIILGDSSLFLMYFFRLVPFDLVQLSGLFVLHIIIIARMKK